MNVPFIDLRRQYLSIKGEIEIAIQNVLDSSQFVLGKNVESFEKEFADYCGSKFAVGVASGTDALTLSLLAAGIAKEDEIITTPFTFVSSVDAISHVGATPIFVDIEGNHNTIDAKKIEEKITNKTKAIIPVHLYGHPSEMETIMEIAKKHNLVVVEDACQAHGAELNGKRVGALGDVGCFSFYPTKNLGAYGEGGMAVTDDKNIAEKIKMLRHIGQKEKYHYEIIGFNSRLHEIQAAILRVKLKYLDRWNELRRKHAKRYNELLSDQYVILPRENSGAKHVYHLFVIKTTRRNLLKTWLFENGIDAMIHYPKPVHMQSSYRHIGHKENSFIIAEKCANEVLSIPMFPELKEEELDYVSKSIKLFFQESPFGEI